MPHSTPLRVGVSSCLLGNPVRFDGGHKRSSFVADQVAQFVEYVPVCPEMGIGLGAPRETIRLVRAGDDVRLVAPKSGTDLTQPMIEYSQRKAEQLAGMDLRGFILKSGSPTCGMERVRVYAESGMPSKLGVGLFARELRKRLPGLPLEEEGRLHDPILRENFFEQVFAYHRLSLLFAGPWQLRDLLAFHTQEKLLLMAHDPQTARKLGGLLAAVGSLSPQALRCQYEEGFSRCLRKQVTARRHFNVLQRILGFFRSAPAHDRSTLSRLLNDFRNGLIPLVVPITMIRHLVERHHVDYLKSQSYLDPHPKQLMLRNH